MRFTLRETGNPRRIDLVFDDGGVNLLSAAGLIELGGWNDRLTTYAASLLVFRSGRSGLFAAGADMEEMRRFDAAKAEKFAALGQTIFDWIGRLPFVTAALIDGDCLGGALDLSLAFDVRLATPRARFAHPGAKLGIVTGFGGTTRWRDIVARPAAQRLFLANERLTAAEALAIGLVDQVAEDHDQELELLSRMDVRQVRYVRELSRQSCRLSRSELQFVGERLAKIYFDQ